MLFPKNHQETSNESGCNHKFDKVARVNYQGAATRICTVCGHSLAYLKFTKQLTMEQLCNTTEIMPGDCLQCDCYKTTKCNGFYPTSKLVKNNIGGLMTLKDYRDLAAFIYGPAIPARPDTRWVQVNTMEKKASDEHHWTDRRIHTIKVDANCEDLQAACKKEMEKRNITYHQITSYKFV